jgi:acyl carrier protein
MTNEEIKSLVLKEIRKIAPEADLDQLDPDADLREQIDLDSMDILNLAIAIHERTGIDIPEADYPKMVTLTGAIDYLSARGK